MGTQNHWIYGFCSTSRIVNNYKAQRFVNWICFCLQVKGGRHMLSWVP
jgi:hypothetical protein